MRRLPNGNWSAGRALIKWPRPQDQYATIALLYEDEEAAFADHTRSAQWQRLPGLRAMSPSARLEKSPDGVAYLDFGWRCYPSGRDSQGRQFRPYESRADRIFVPIIVGGSNRGGAIRHLRRSRELWILFCLIQSVDNDHVRQAARRLGQNTQISGLGLSPVLLPGLRIFDRFIPPGEEVAYWSSGVA